MSDQQLSNPVETLQQLTNSLRFQKCSLDHLRHEGREAEELAMELRVQETEQAIAAIRAVYQIK